MSWNLSLGNYIIPQLDYMSFKDFFKTKSTETTDMEKKEEKRVVGKIIHVEKEKGWGFISSPDIPFTRIFFHWTALEPDTLNFTKLKKQMKVEFTPKVFEDSKWRAIKIKVMEDERSENQDSRN